MALEEDKPMKEALKDEDDTPMELFKFDFSRPLFCIKQPDISANYEIKPELISMLTKFHGLLGEDPFRHLKELHMVCSLVRLQGVTDEQIRLLVFPFSLAGKAKDWLLYLPPCSITTWTEMQEKFVHRFFPASREHSLRQEINSVQQNDGESLHDYWERFQRLCARCPNHRMSERELIFCFYNGLLHVDWGWVTAACGERLLNKTVEEAWEIISNMVESYQYKTGDDVPEKTKESAPSIDQRLGALATLTEKFIMGVQCQWVKDASNLGGLI